MWKLFDNTQIIKESRASGRGGNIIKELLMFFIMVGVVFSILSVVELIPIFLLFDIDLNNATEKLQSVNVTIASLYVRVFTAIVFVLFCKFAQKRSWESIGIKEKGMFVEYLKGLIVGFVMFGTIMAIGHLCKAFYFVGKETQINYTMLLIVFGGFIIQGAQEEIICRGYIMTSITRKNNAWVAIFVNSAIFALMHIGNAGFGALAIINLVLFGIFASVYMLRTDNIAGVCAVHTVWNFVQGSFFGLSVSGTELMPSVFRVKPIGHAILTGGEFGPEASIITTFVLISAIAIVVMPTIIKKGDSINERQSTESDQSIEKH